MVPLSLQVLPCHVTGSMFLTLTHDPFKMVNPQNPKYHFDRMKHLNLLILLQLRFGFHTISNCQHMQHLRTLLPELPGFKYLAQHSKVILV